jgi:hypothetical protein
MILFQELKRLLSEALVQFLWDQWVSIGVAGGTRACPVPFVVDPEALVLATSRFAKEDPRLFGEALDWMAVNGRLLSAQRLKSMCQRSTFGEIRVLAAMDGHLKAHASGSGAKLLGFASALESRASLDEWFGGSAFAPRGHSRRPDPVEREAFLFRMRSFFGINARAEIFSWLLLEGRPGHPAVIGRETDWGAKTVQVVLNEMAESGLVFLTEGEREKKFRIDVEQWKAFFAKGPRPRWWSQAPFYEACFGLMQMLGELEAVEESSDSAKAIKIRASGAKLMNRFVLAKQPGRFEEILHLRGRDLVDEVHDETRRLVDDLSNREALLMPGYRTG